MNQHVAYQKGTKRIINSWTSFTFVFFFFYIVGDLIMSWWHNAWWAWLIIAVSLFGAITTTLRSIANRSESMVITESDDHSTSFAYHYQTDDENSNNINTETHSFESSSKYCKNCGAEVSDTNRYCAFCGEVV